MYTFEGAVMRLCVRHDRDAHAAQVENVCRLYGRRVVDRCASFDVGLSQLFERPAVTAFDGDGEGGVRPVEYILSHAQSLSSKSCVLKGGDVGFGCLRSYARVPIIGDAGLLYAASACLDATQAVKLDSVQPTARLPIRIGLGKVPSAIIA